MQKKATAFISKHFFYAVSIEYRITLLCFSCAIADG